MDSVKVFTILRAKGFSQEEASQMVHELEARDVNLSSKLDLSHAKGELQGNIKDLEIKLISKYNFNSLLIGSVTVVGFLLNYYLKK